MEFQLTDSLGFLPWCLGLTAQRQDFCGITCPARGVLCPKNRWDNPWHFVVWGIAGGCCCGGKKDPYCPLGKRAA